MKFAQVRCLGQIFLLLVSLTGCGPSVTAPTLPPEQAILLAGNFTTAWGPAGKVYLDSARNALRIETPQAIFLTRLDSYTDIDILFPSRRQYAHWSEKRYWKLRSTKQFAAAKFLQHQCRKLVHDNEMAFAHWKQDWRQALDIDRCTWSSPHEVSFCKGKWLVVVTTLAPFSSRAVTGKAAQVATARL